MNSLFDFHMRDYELRSPVVEFRVRQANPDWLTWKNEWVAQITLGIDSHDIVDSLILQDHQNGICISGQRAMLQTCLLYFITSYSILRS